MSARRNARPVVKVGARVQFRGVTWQVVALSGQDIRLAGPDGGGQAVLAGHLFADPSFTVIGADAPQAAPQWGLFETAPATAREKALAWQRHVREVECGLTGGPGSQGTVRPQYDPQRHTLAEREQAKAEELTALGFGRVARTTVQRMRLACSTTAPPVLPAPPGGPTNGSSPPSVKRCAAAVAAPAARSTACSR
ncbi:hypothetical protein [Streptomyces coelicoflavus]|uniref:hypothetical protein n=1 Tax=Streptomyces coelicoflavus TaxID=285562 RepID=UPI001EF29912